MNVGDKVAVSGNCTCPQYRMKDCYHRPDRGRQSPILRHILETTRACGYKIGTALGLWKKDITS